MDFLLQMGLVDSFIFLLCLCNSNICGQYYYVENLINNIKRFKQEKTFKKTFKEINL